MRIGLTVLFVHFCYTAVAFQSSKIATVRFVNKEGHSIRSVQLELRSGEIQKILTTSSGYEIHLKSDFEKGDLLVEASGYRTQTIPIIFTEKDDLLVLGNWLMQEMVAAEVEAPLLRMSDLELWTASDDREQLGVALQAQRDLFLSTAAFQFGSAFFRLRGLDASHRSVRINGIAMNHFMTGRPNWGQWGGLNDFTNVAGKTNYGLSPAQFDMGGVLGSLQINLRPSQMRLGSKFSQAFSNATYQFRSMVSHVGHYNQWDFALLGSTRVAKEGYREGTPYQAFSLLAFLERQWNSVHQTWGGFIYTPNSSGKSAPLTQEVFDLKGNKYNPYWGWQKGRIRNARIKTTKIPSFFLTHRYQPTSSSIWHVNIGVQLGQTAYSRLQHQGHWLEDNILVGGGQNPDPVYYQKLPSYFLRELKNPDYEKGYWERNQLISQGQLDWSRLYESNSMQPAAVYFLSADKEQLNRVAFSLQLQKIFKKGLQIRVEGSVELSHSRQYAQPESLLGADATYNFDGFIDAIQLASHDLRHFNQKIFVGTPFQYHFSMRQKKGAMTTHVIYEKSGFEVFGAIQLQYHQHQRTGHFKNGRYPNHSFGKGAVFSHFTGGIKTGIAYSFDGHHHFTTRMGFWKRPAAVGSYYLNLREAEIVNPFVSTENAFVFEGSYRLTREKVRGRFTLYSISLRNGNRQGFYYADGIQGHQAFFVQEHLNGIHRRYRGFEFAGQYEPIEGVAFLGVATVGTARYMSNPHLLHQTAPTAASRLSGFDNGTQVFGFSYLQGYPLANGPQQAYSLGFEYKDPNYWRMGLHVNYFSHAYVAINAFRRTRNFYQDFDGIPFADYDSKEAESILAPERIPSYLTLNATASKSWRLGKQYVGFFISVQNLLNSIHKTGGFEQARNANYQTVLVDQRRIIPLFAPKYWWGRGTTFFASMYYRL